MDSNIIFNGSAYKTKKITVAINSWFSQKWCVESIGGGVSVQECKKLNKTLTSIIKIISK